MAAPDKEKTYLIDTNIILRFLLNDHGKHSPKATLFMTDVSKGTKTAEILDCVLLECIYVMEKFYEIPKSEIVDRLSRIMNFTGIVNANKALLLKALFNYQQFNIDFVDALLASYSSQNSVVASFDKDFEKLNAVWENLA